MLIGCKVGDELSSSLHEHRDCVLDRQRRDRVFLLRREIQPLTRRRQHLRFQCRDHRRNVRKQLLEVVEQQQSVLAREELHEVVGCPDDLRDCRLDQSRVRHRRQRNEPDTVREIVDDLRCGLQRKPGLP